MNFKRKENDLIWESLRPNIDQIDDEFDFEDFEEESEEDSIIVTSEDPMSPLDVVIEPNDMDDDSPEDDSEMSELVMTDIKKLDKHTKELLAYAQQNKLEPWMQAKIVKAAVYVADVCDQLDCAADFANDQDSDVDVDL